MPSEIIPSLDLAPSVPSRIVTVHATDVTKGTALAGKEITFKLRGDLRVPADGAIISAGSVTLTLDAEGKGRVRLPCYTTDTRADSADGEWYLEVKKSWVGQTDLIRVPVGATQIALAAIEPVRELPLHAAPAWMVTGAGVEVVEGAQWGATVVVTGGVARFRFTVPPGATPWELTSPLTADTVIANLPSGLYQLRSASIATALGLPGNSAGSLWVHRLDAAGTWIRREWRPTNSLDVWEQRKHGATETEWERKENWARPNPLLMGTAVEQLGSGLYSVLSSSVAHHHGLPGGLPGSLWVHRPSHDNGRREWRPFNSVEVWHSYLWGTEWSTWEQASQGSWGPGPDDPDEEEIEGVTLTLQDTGHSFVPTSVGIDGNLYGWTTDGRYPVRSTDGLQAAPEQGPDISALTSGERIVHVEATSAGYFVIWRVSNMQNEVWFSAEWEGGYEKVLDIGPWHHTAWAKPRVIAGETWIVLGEYTYEQIPSEPLTRYLSTDGGQTWVPIRQTQVADDHVNAHCHTALITASGRIYVSEGDGPNRWFGYSDDRGRTWVDVDLAGSQPTTLIDFGDRIGTSPDAGSTPPGMWLLDPNTHRFQIMWNLSKGGPYSNASQQYGRSTYAQAGSTGPEAYVMFSPSSSGNRETYIGATPNGGVSWGVVATIDLGAAGTLNTGIVGPDRHGYLYMRGTSLPTYGGNVIRMPKLEWA